MRLVVEPDGLPREFTPELALRRAITMLVADGTAHGRAGGGRADGTHADGSRAGWAWLGRDGHRLGAAGVCRVRPGRTLHVVGSTALAERMRDLLAAGAQPGWHLHPVPPGSTPLERIMVPLARRTGTNRCYNLLDRAGFRTVEEVAATPDEALLAIRNIGRRLVDAVREILPEVDGGPAASPDDAGVRHLRLLLGLLPPRSDRAFWTELAAGRGLDPDELAAGLTDPGPDAARLCLSAFDGAEPALAELLDRVAGYRAPRGVAGRRWAGDVVDTAWRLYLPQAAVTRGDNPRAEVS